MGFKIDFEKLRQDRWNKMTQDEKNHETKYEKLIEDNIFYKTYTTLIDKYMNVKYNKEIKETTIEVQLYRRINYHTLEVEDKFLLKFHQSPWEYNFDKKFIDSMLKNCKNENKQYGLCVDAGKECYILRKECIRIINESVKVLESKNIEICEDNHPNCTKMLKEIGWS